jgi:hypothetical protein
VRTFLKQDGVSNDPETFSYVMRTYERVCAHTKTSQISLPRGLFWAHRQCVKQSFRVSYQPNRVSIGFTGEGGCELECHHCSTSVCLFFFTDCILSPSATVGLLETSYDDTYEATSSSCARTLSKSPSIPSTVLPSACPRSVTTGQ